MIIKPHSKVIFIGDSITNSGRMQPQGEGLCGAVGKRPGYVQYVDALLNAVYPKRAIRVVNKGHGGDTVHELKAR